MNSTKQCTREERNIHYKYIYSDCNGCAWIVGLEKLHLKLVNSVLLTLVCVAIYFLDLSIAFVSEQLAIQRSIY